MTTFGLRHSRYGMDIPAKHTLHLRPVRNPADLKGLKIRVIQTPTYVRTFELLGASPTPMAFGEVYTSIQTGVLDGWEDDGDGGV